MTTFGIQTTNVGPVPVSDMEAISAEFVDRVNAFGGRDAYCAAFGIDRRNFDRYMKGRVPELPQLMVHLRNLGVDQGEFFASAVKRTQA